MAKKPSQVSRNDRPEVKIEPYGLSTKAIDSLREAIINHKLIRQALAKTKNRMIGLQFLDEESEKKKDKPQQIFRAYFADYTNDRTVIASGSVRDPSALTVSESSIQQIPNEEEYQEAIEIISNDTHFGAAMKSGGFRPYAPMPDVIQDQEPDGHARRIITIGLLPKTDLSRHEIVAVHLGEKRVIRFDRHDRGRSPRMSIADTSMCGLPQIETGLGTSQGIAGSAKVTITYRGKVIWSFIAVRPSASSGLRGSGIELRNVDYKGKRVLFRAHVPMLNVKYDMGTTYRDWQYAEGHTHGVGSDPVPGFRLCNAKPTNILDDGDDGGDFVGTAVYVDGLEVVFVCKMIAGWYRYISQWRFHVDGTIRPRFGFTAVQSSHVCEVHHHHCYWRFDFDVVTAGNNLVREFNDPPIIPGTNWHDKNYEIKRPRDPAHHRKWRIQNKTTGDAYEVIPGPNDGEASSSPDAPFGRGDVWVLRYHPNEIDDGVNHTDPPCEVVIDPWVNGEPVNGQDIVFWYAAHFTHDVAHEPPGHFGHLVGPDLRPVHW